MLPVCTCPPHTPKRDTARTSQCTRNVRCSNENGMIMIDRVQIGHCKEYPRATSHMTTQRTTREQTSMMSTWCCLCTGRCTPWLWRRRNPLPQRAFRSLPYGRLVHRLVIHRGQDTMPEGYISAATSCWCQQRPCFATGLPTAARARCTLFAVKLTLKVAYCGARRTSPPGGHVPNVETLTCR